MFDVREKGRIARVVTGTSGGGDTSGRVSRGWNASLQVKSSPVARASSVLPWKKKIPKNARVHQFSHINDDGGGGGHMEGVDTHDRAGDSPPGAGSGVGRATPVRSIRQVKVGPLSSLATTHGQPQRANSNVGKTGMHLPVDDIRCNSSQSRRNHVGNKKRNCATSSSNGNRRFSSSSVMSTDSGRRHMYESSPASSYRRSMAEDDDHLQHLITYETNGIDNDVILTVHSCASECGGSINPISNSRSYASEDDHGDGWSIGVRRFQAKDQIDDDNNSVFSPSIRNVGYVPSASYARDSLLKKEFKTIQESLSHSYKKYRDRKKHDSSGESAHAVAYQYVDNWLKKKKVSSNNSRISKNEFEIFYYFFIKKIQHYFAQSNLKVLNYDSLIEEFLQSKIFEGKIEAYNFLMKINLNDDGMISLNDFNACVQSSRQDLNVTNFKAFVKKLRKHDERKQKLDETREKARELHRQRQMEGVEGHEGGGLSTAISNRSHMRKGSVIKLNM